MSAPLDRFNRIARYYDYLKGIVFGRAIHVCQLHFLESIPSGANVLILGGGSGEMLPILMKMNPDCRVWFVEASSEMLRLARERLPARYRSRVEFTHGTENVLQSDKPQDAVITNFFLDLFPEKTLRQVCNLINANVRCGGVWLVSDFVPTGKPWQRFLLWLMYRFFELTTGIVATRLPMWEDQVRAGGMKEISARTYYGGFIKSVVYRKDFSPQETPAL